MGDKESPNFLNMIEQDKIKDLILNNLKTGHVLVELSISPSNQIFVVVDSLTGVNIGDCVEYTKLIEQNFDREVEDYELSVSSGGIDLPLTAPIQFEKNMNKTVELLTKSGKKWEGILKMYDGISVQIDVEVKELLEGQKRKTLVTKTLDFNIDQDIKTIKPVFKF